MGKFYNNHINVNNGVTLDGPAPLDDRLVLNGFDSLYVRNRRGELYGKMYYGAQVTVLDPLPGRPGYFKAYSLMLQDATPYMTKSRSEDPDTDIEVNAQNYLEFWRSLDVDIVKSEMFKGGDLDDDQTMITNCGMLPAGTSVSELEGMTVSEIFQKILFEIAYPQRTKNASTRIKFADSSPYKTVVEVGSSYPHVSDMAVDYQSEAWNWFSTVNSSYHGTEKNLSVLGKITYYYNNVDSNVNGMPIDMADVCPDGQSCPYSGILGIRCQDTCPFRAVYNNKKAEEGVNGWLYATVEQVAGDYAVDSRNRVRNPETMTEDEYYQAPRTDTLSTGTITFIGGWRVYTNAVKTYTAVGDAWNARNTEPGEFQNNDTKNPCNLLCYQSSHKMYFQWPSGTTAAQTFHIWVPESYKISSVKAASPTAANTFNVSASATKASAITQITNTQGATGNFYNWTISKQPGITTVEVTFVKA